MSASRSVSKLRVLRHTRQKRDKYYRHNTLPKFPSRGDGLYANELTYAHDLNTIASQRNLDNEEGTKGSLLGARHPFRLS